MPEAITLTGATLTLADVLAVARGCRPVRLGPRVAAAVGASRTLVEQALTRGELAPKDGLALINSNALSVGAAVLLIDDVAALLDLAALAAALSFEGLRANPGPLLPEVAAARPAPGQAAAAALLRGFLAGSALWDKGARAVQDPLSFRCVAPVHGAALAAL